MAAVTGKPLREPMRPGVGTVSSLLEGNGIWRGPLVSCAARVRDKQRRKILRRILKVSSRELSFAPSGLLPKQLTQGLRPGLYSIAASRLSVDVLSGVLFSEAQSPLVRLKFGALPAERCGEHPRLLPRRLRLPRCWWRDRLRAPDFSRSAAHPMPDALCPGVHSSL